MAKSSHPQQRSLERIRPGLRWLRFPHRLEAQFRAYQQAEAVAAFRIQWLPLFLLHLLLLSGIYALAPEAVRGRWISLYLWVGVIILLAGGLAQIRSLDRYFSLYAGIGSFLAVAIAVAVPGLVDDPVASALAQAGVMYTVIIVYAVLGLRLPVAAAAGWGGGLLGGLVAYRWGQGVDWLVMHRTYTGLSVLGMWLCYNGERRERRLFFQRRELLRQQTKLAAQAARLQRYSRHDTLTGLANQAYFHECLEREARRCWRRRVPLALMLVDVDGFQHYNEAHGKARGDQCLQALAAELRRYARRSGDLVARLGGDQFALLYPDSGRQEAGLIAARLGAAVRALGIPYPEARTGGAISVGVGVAVSSSADHCTSVELLNRAQQALRLAKARGADEWALWTEQTGAAAYADSGPPEHRR